MSGNEEYLEKLRVERIAPEGLGFGHGSISAREVSPAIMEQVAEVIQSPAALVPVESDDDGCPDGRGTTEMIQGKDQTCQPVNRAKVFGGGATMAMAALVGTGNAESGSIADAFEIAADRLSMRDINFGAHSAEHPAEGKSGCGAIDEAPKNIDNIFNFEEEIIGTLEALAGPQASKPELHSMAETAIENFKDFKGTGSDYRGADVLDGILERDKKVAVLGDSHKEVGLVINTDIEDMTFDQEAVRRATGGQAQVFSVDVPRMKQIAEGLFDDPESQRQALVSMLVYSLGTAGTLTDGSLPVDVVYAHNKAISLTA